MKKKPDVKQIARIIEEIAPRALALPGDPVGLQCGDWNKIVRRVMIALDATRGTVSQAVASKADLLVTHHPLLFEPLTPDTMNGPTGTTLTQAIREGLPVYSAHTNLDASPQGINTSLADLIDLRERRILQASEQGLFKVVVFVPPDKAEGVKSAAFRAGAGQIGNYSGCSFAVEGTGTFHPEEGARPSIGQPGSDEKLKEVRLEMTVRAEDLNAVLSGVRKAHPYEEAAVDIYSAAAVRHDAGLGISGRLPQRSTVGQIAAKIASSLKTRGFRLVGLKGSPVSKVAVCAGSGSSLLEKAAAGGAHLYITGDIKYHEARRAEDLGIQVLDVGHFAPERYGIIGFGKLLEKKFAGLGLGVEVAIAKERDPFVPVS